jgi:mersacidin/lichenicidin family type 2 lantibiotic
MKQSKLIRAWRNQDVRTNANEDEANPAGIAELDEALLGAVGGATNVSCQTTRNAGPGTFCRACNQ